MLNPYDPDRTFQDLEAAAEERAEAEYKAYLLEKHGEILMASLMLEAKQDGTAIGLCKEAARTAAVWRVHVDGEAVAIRNRSRARAKYANLQALATARQTQEASRRALAG